MRRPSLRGWGPLWIALLLGPACSRAGAFVCADDSQCVSGGALGVCESSGYCSFPDPECPSGKVYGGHAGGGLGGSCVPPGEVTTSGSGTGDATGSSTGVSGDTEPTTGQSTATTGPGTTTGSTSTTGPGTTGVGSTSSGSTGSGGSSTGPTCADLGDGCTLDTDCCNDCMVCTGGQCVANTGALGSCGECMACNALAECVIEEGQACGADIYDCSQKVWGVSNSTCFALKNNLIASSCNALGQCAPPDPADCPNEQGGEIVSCSSTCYKNGNNCTPGTDASAVTAGTLCFTNQTTPGCDKQCANGTGSQLYQRSCNSSGTCAFVSVLETCDPYRCENEACLTSCVDNSDCITFFGCNTMTGVCE